MVLLENDASHHSVVLLFSCSSNFEYFILKNIFDWKRTTVELDLVCSSYIFSMHCICWCTYWWAYWSLGSQLWHVLCQHCHVKFSLFLFSAHSTDRKVTCVCENGCTDTCTGHVCFFTWNDGQVVRGCFEKEQREQCIVSGIPNVFAECCYTDYCNTNITLPPKSGQELWMTY